MQTISNRLSSQSSPYLIQHAQQPVDWYPWCEDAFRKAEKEDKPVFLSIGYSTCHWCHVMARESFENTEIAELLNRSFISIKVDREERPDLDSLYMKVCQAMTGSGGWPMSIFLTPDKKPFFAGTYFPPDNRGGIIGFRHLLETISQKWQQDRTALLRSASDIVKLLKKQQNERTSQQIRMDETLLKKAVWQFCQTYDKGYGGFGNAPKFPSPHNLLFLLRQYEITSDTQILSMVETTLQKMYEGGLFDHIGYGFSRYATDRAFQIPHFEKMLYDNAMLIMAYARTYDITQNSFFLQVAEQTAEYVLREMTHTDGGFYSAQDADSDGMEGGYYVFRPAEIIDVLGKEQGEKFNRCYGITEAGNFEGRNIPHLTDRQEAGNFADCLPKLREYRLARCRLALDDKILTAWNGLMLAAMAQLARLTGKECYLQAALRCEQFISEKLCENGRLYTGYRNGSRSGFGYLDDYAFMGFAMLELFQTTQDTRYLERAKTLCKRTVSDFWDEDRGGFYLSGKDNETLILRTKETYDGAIPSGNSVMAHNLVRLAILDANATPDSQWDVLARRQLEFLVGQAALAPMGHAFYLLALSDWLTPPAHITVVLEENADCAQIMQRSPLNANVKVLRQPTAEYPLKDGKTTYYVCTDNACLPPVNTL